MSVALSKEQRAAIAEIERWYERGAREYKLGGLAGTGKTTIAAALPALLGLSAGQVAYCTYTGKAAHVLNRRLGEASATTIHRLIYEPEERHCGRCPRGRGEVVRCHGESCGVCGIRWTRVPALASGLKLIVVDEASMVNEELHDDLASYGVPIVWIGDHGQLPPVRGVSRLIDDPDFRLETVHRQVADSPILKLAMCARDTGQIAYGEYGPGVVKRENDGEIEVGGADWSELLILCGTNRTRVALNRAARDQRGFSDEHPVPGDRVICLRNNYTSEVFNGTTGTILDCEPSESSKTYRATIQLDGDDRLYEHGIAREQFNHKSTLSEVPRYTDLWDYGYCLTVHKAQGSEAERVILIEERLPGPPGRQEALAQHKRWLYTGITRAQSELEILA